MNAHTLVAGVDTIPLGRLFAAYWIEARFEFLRMVRNPAFGGPIVLVPLGVYLLFAVAISGEAIANDPSLGDLLFSGFSVFAISLPALFSVGCTLAQERDAGLMRLRRALPAPLGAWLIAKLFVAVGFAALAYFPMLTTAVLLDKVTLSASELAAMSAVFIAGAIPFAAVGLLIGSLVSGSAAPGYANLFYLPCVYLSGLFFPLPKFLHMQTLVWPAFHLNQIAYAAGGIETTQFIPPQLAIAVLLGLTVICSWIAIWRVARKG